MGFVNNKQINKLNINMINMSKSKELVFHLIIKTIYRHQILMVLKVSCVKLLGLWLQEDLGISRHVDYVIHICNQQVYLLNQLKQHGLPPVEIQRVFEAIVMSCMLYASPAGSRYASANDIESLQKHLIRAKCWRIVDKDYVLEDSFNSCDSVLFRTAQNTNHCLSHLFFMKLQRCHKMYQRFRGRNFALQLLE